MIQPDLFIGIGDAIVERARLRSGDFSTEFERRARDAAVRERALNVDLSRDCVLCGADPGAVGHKRATVGGRDVAVCRDCAALAVSICDYKPDLRACLVILALNVERAAQGSDGGAGAVEWFDPETGYARDFRATARHIAAEFGRGFYAAACRCPAHSAARESVREPVAVATPGLEVLDVPRQVLRTFPDNWPVRLRGVLMTAKEATDALAADAGATVRPPLGPLSKAAARWATQSAAAAWRSVASSDSDARAYWAAVVSGEVPRALTRKELRGLGIDMRKPEGRALMGQVVLAGIDLGTLEGRARFDAERGDLVAAAAAAIAVAPRDVSPGPVHEPVGYLVDEWGECHPVPGSGDGS